MMMNLIKMYGKVYGLAFFLCLIGLSGCGAQSPQPATTQSLPRFEAASCPFKLGSGITEGKNVKCGYIVVPEDRSSKNSPLLRLAIAIFHTPRANPAPDPTIYLEGGPGGASLRGLGQEIDSTNLATLVTNRDLILFDQRGTGYSSPQLDCPEVTQEEETTADKNLSRDQAVQSMVQALEQCHTRLVGAGINLHAYTTIDNAADIHDIIDALGYPQVNLYSVSYGTRLALTVMRAFPAHIRSVVLDSSVPPQINLFTSLVGNYTRSFNVLFHGCTIDPACNATYPNFKDVFYHLIDKLNISPITIQVASFVTHKHYNVVVNGDALVQWFFNAMYATQLIPFLPGTIFQLDKGNATLLSRLYAKFPFYAGTSWGTFYSIECGEDMFPTTLHEATDAAQKLPSEIQWSSLFEVLVSSGACQFWGTHAVPTIQKQPVRSTIPTLILAGEYDPVAPPANDLLAKQTLTKSFYFLFPGTGHGVLSTHPCPNHIMEVFQDHPDQQPDATCIASMSEPNFTQP